MKRLFSNILMIVIVGMLSACGTNGTNDVKDKEIQDIAYGILSSDSKKEVDNSLKEVEIKKIKESEIKEATEFKVKEYDIQNLYEVRFKTEFSLEYGDLIVYVDYTNKVGVGLVLRK